MLLRARIVYPVTSPPIEDGAITIQNGKILEVGRFRDLSSSEATQTDLGEVILLPGLINAHCHLDYTGMAGMIPPPTDFLDWIEAIIAIKANWDYSDFADSWLEGTRQLLATGTTTVADMEAVPELIPEVWDSTPLRIHSFMELINVRGQQSPANQISAAVRRLKSHPNPKGGLGLSPHALYSTNRELLLGARAKDLPLAIHVSESALEDEMYRHQSGRVYNWLNRNERDMGDCTGKSPVRILSDMELLGDRTLAVHCNYLDNSDIALLARTRTNVVHCPSSHAYFGHQTFRANELSAAGINISLGTDSLATTRKSQGRKPTLNLYGEMRLFAAANPDFSFHEIIRMVTCNGAQALGLAGRRGEFVPGSDADLITIESAGDPAQTAEAIVRADNANLRTMIGGRWLAD
jgi:aminodeoxyfutalosine deaminase